MLSHSEDVGLVCSRSLRDKYREKYGENSRFRRMRESLSAIKFDLPLSRRKTESQARGQLLQERLLSLPNELHIMILLQLETKDLFSLRLASRVLKQLVDNCVSAIVRKYARSLDPLHLCLYPPPPPGMAHLRYLIDNEHRLSTSRQLAVLIADFFCEKMLGMTSRRSKKAFEKTYNKIMTGLVPLFFTLSHFFENYRRMILERAMKQWRANQPFQITTGGPTLWDDQVSILDRYSPELMLDCYHAYGYLLQVFEYQLRPHRLEKFRRSIAGQRTEPASTREVEVLLMLGGMEQVCRVLRRKSYGARRDALDGFIRQLKPTTNPRWRELWQSLGVESDVIQLGKVPSLRLMLPALHLVWVPSALKLLLCNKIIDRVDFEADTGARSPTDFVFDLLGYNALEDEESEDDSEDGSDDEWESSDEDAESDAQDDDL